MACSGVIKLPHQPCSPHAIYLQYGHPGEVGRNGCFTVDVIQGLIDNLSVYQARGHPMAKLEEAVMWIGRRKAEREARGVHQTDQA